MEMCRAPWDEDCREEIWHPIHQNWEEEKIIDA